MSQTLTVFSSAPASRVPCSSKARAKRAPRWPGSRTSGRGVPRTDQSRTWSRVPTARVEPSGEKASEIGSDGGSSDGGASRGRTTPRRRVNQGELARPVDHRQGRAVGADGQAVRASDADRPVGTRGLAAVERIGGEPFAGRHVKAASRRRRGRQGGAGVRPGPGPGPGPSVRSWRSRRVTASGSPALQIRTSPPREEGQGPAVAAPGQDPADGPGFGRGPSALGGGPVGPRPALGPRAGRSGGSTSATGAGRAADTSGAPSGSSADQPPPVVEADDDGPDLVPGPDSGGAAPGPAPEPERAGRPVGVARGDRQEVAGPEGQRRSGSSPDSGSWTCADRLDDRPEARSIDAWLAARVRPSGEKARSSTRSRVGRAAIRACEVRSQSSTPPPRPAAARIEPSRGLNRSWCDEALVQAQARQRLGLGARGPRARSRRRCRRRPAARPAPGPGPWR